MKVKAWGFQKFNLTLYSDLFFNPYDSEVKELLEKRNTLEMERIQLLDKIAELQISIARVHQGTNSETRSESGATLRKRFFIEYFFFY